MKDAEGQSLFGAIEQVWRRAERPRTAAKRSPTRWRTAAGRGARMSDELPRSLKFATVWLLLGRCVFLGFQWRAARGETATLLGRAAA